MINPKTIVSVKPSIFTDYLIDEYDVHGQPCKFSCSDIHVLNNPSILASLDAVSLQTIYDKFASATSQPLPDGVTDKDLVTFCKSRYITLPCDVDEYINNMTNVFEEASNDFSQKIKRCIDDRRFYDTLSKVDNKSDVIKSNSNL